MKVKSTFYLITKVLTKVLTKALTKVLTNECQNANRWPEFIYGKQGLIQAH